MHVLPFWYNGWLPPPFPPNHLPLESVTEAEHKAFAPRTLFLEVFRAVSHPLQKLALLTNCFSTESHFSFSSYDISLHVSSHCSVGTESIRIDHAENNFICLKLHRSKFPVTFLKVLCYMRNAREQFNFRGL